MSGYWQCGCKTIHAIPARGSVTCMGCNWSCGADGHIVTFTGDVRALPSAPEPVAAPVEGYRVWRVQRDDHVTLTRQLVQQLAADHEAGRNPFQTLMPGARLHPVGIPAGAWERVHHAVCVGGGMSASSAAYMPVAPPHEAPQRGCACGLWALKDEAEARAVAADYQLTSGYAVGKLRLWGRVVEHTRGYRGQHAQPVSLTYVGDGPEAEEVAGELSAFYGCPCTLQRPAVPDPYPPGFHPTVTFGGLRSGGASSSYAAQLASWNVLNSGLAAQLAVQQSAAISNAALAYVAGNAAPYDRGGRRAWPVRFARWTAYKRGRNPVVGVFAFLCHLLLSTSPAMLASLLIGFWALPLLLPWLAFWIYATATDNKWDK